MNGADPPANAAHAAALQHARAGRPVVVLHGIVDGRCACGKRDCSSPGKHPVTAHGLRDATTDAAAIERLFDLHRAANYGLLTGASSGWFVIDVDPPLGEDSLAALQAEIGPLPETREHRTPRGGRHLVFACDDAEIGNSTGKLGANLDTRGNGGYVVGPGSVGASGASYEVVRNGPPAPLPPALRERLLRKRAPTGATGVPRAAPHGCTPYGRALLDRHVAEVRAASEGTRRDTLNTACLIVGHYVAGGEVDEALARAELLAAAVATGLSEHESRKTVDDGIADGRREPQSAPDERSASAQDPGGGEADEGETVTTETPRLVPREGVDLRSQPLTDAGAAERVAALFGEHVRHVPGLGFHLWTGTVWTKDDRGTLVQCVVAMARETFRQAVDLPEEQRDPLVSFARRCEQEPRIRGVLAILATIPSIALSASALDADPDALNVENGIVHLPTKTLRPHDPRAYCTKIARAAYRPDATAPTWLRFQKQVACEDEQLLVFKQRAYGYSATGHTREQCVFLCHGKGSNGKTTEAETVRYVLGGYVRNADFSTFTAGKRPGGPRPDIVRLVGARLVTALEGGEDQRLDEAFVKAITGGDANTARDMYKSEIEFTPALKPWLYSNYKPRIHGTDEGIWRRLRLVPYLAHFPRDAQDKTLGAKLRAEAEGVLTWIVEGACRWYAEGLPEVASIETATSSYRSGEDVLGTFLAERCVQREDAVVGSGALYKAYRAWCATSGEDPVRDRDFKSLLEDLGFIWKRQNTGAQWYGLELAGGLFEGQAVTA